jgi:hypothetical protein
VRPDPPWSQSPTHEGECHHVPSPQPENGRTMDQEIVSLRLKAFQQRPIESGLAYLYRHFFSSAHVPVLLCGGRSGSIIPGRLASHSGGGMRKTGRATKFKEKNILSLVRHCSSLLCRRQLGGAYARPFPKIIIGTIAHQGRAFLCGKSLYTIHSIEALIFPTFAVRGTSESMLHTPSTTLP